jgi:hypothetical protein
MTPPRARVTTGAGPAPGPVGAPGARGHAACILAHMHWTAAIATLAARLPGAAIARPAGPRASRGAAC